MRCVCFHHGKETAVRFFGVLAISLGVKIIVVFITEICYYLCHLCTISSVTGVRHRCKNVDVNLKSLKKHDQNEISLLYYIKTSLIIFI